MSNWVCWTKCYISIMTNNQHRCLTIYCICIRTFISKHLIYFVFLFEKWILITMSYFDISFSELRVSWIECGMQMKMTVNSSLHFCFFFAWKKYIEIYIQFSIEMYICITYCLHTAENQYMNIRARAITSKSSFWSTTNFML